MLTAIYVPEDCGPTVSNHFVTLTGIADGLEVPTSMVERLNTATMDLELYLSIPYEAESIGLHRADVLAAYVAAYNAVLEFCNARRETI